MPLKIIRQNITKLKVDAIVNATNPSFDATGGLDHYILNKPETNWTRIVENLKD